MGTRVLLRRGDFIVTMKPGAVRVGRVVKTYPGVLAKFFVGVETENPYPNMTDLMMRKIMERKFPRPMRTRVTYRPFLPYYGQTDWKAALLGSPKMRTFKTQREAYDEVDRYMRAVCGSNPPAILRMVRLMGVLRR